MESTLLYSFIKAARLKRWLARSDCPPAIKELKSLFDKLYTSKRQDDAGFTNEDGHGDSEENLFACGQAATTTFQATPDALRPLIKRSKVVLQARLKRQGIIFSTSS